MIRLEDFPDPAEAAKGLAFNARSVEAREDVRFISALSLLFSEESQGQQAFALLCDLATPSAPDAEIIIVSEHNEDHPA